MEPWGKKVYFGTAGAAVSIVNNEGAYRESLITDLYDIGRIVDVLDHIHFFQRAVVPRDIPDPYEMDFNTCYASVMATTKHVGSSWVDPKHLAASLEMLHMIAGGERQWRERPFVSQSNCFVVPPMKFAYDACRCLELAVAGGMPVLLLSAGQAGATAPAALAGALAQEVAEVLAGSSMSMRSNPATRRFSAPGASFRTCAPARCRAAAPSRRCCRPRRVKWRISMTSRAAPLPA
jgi:trimethylamine---corrinoid protein Co-methyltransferase